MEQEAFEIVNGEYNSVNNLISNQNFIKSLSGISSITINNAESMIINNSETQTILNQALNGDIEYNEFDKALLKKIEEYADSLKKTRTSGKSCRA